MKMYQPYVGTDIATNGVATFVVEGTACDVDGELYVAMGEDYMCRATPDRGWCRTRGDAMRAAADKVAAMGRVLLAQAERLEDYAKSLRAEARVLRGET